MKTEIHHYHFKKRSAVNRTAYSISRTKSHSVKDEKFLSLCRDEAMEAVESFILSLPSGVYTLYTEGRAAYHLPTVVFESLGIYAMLQVSRSFLLGLSVKHPKKIQVSFTLGLDTIYLK